LYYFKEGAVIQNTNANYRSGLVGGHGEGFGTEARIEMNHL